MPPDSRSLFSLRQKSTSRLVGLALIILLHIALISLLVETLAHRSVERARAPIVARIIRPPRPAPTEAPPPPPRFAPPPPPYVPPPEVHIATPAPAGSTAITGVTSVKPPPAAPPAPIRIEPAIDSGQSRPPEYPIDSRRSGEEGAVILAVLVDADGRVVDARLKQSSGFPRLDGAALKAARSDYRFRPGTLDGKPAEMWLTFKINWKLR